MKPTFSNTGCVADILDAIHKVKSQETVRIAYYSPETYHRPIGNSRQRRKAHRHNDATAQRFFKWFEEKLRK